MMIFINFCLLYRNIQVSNPSSNFMNQTAAVKNRVQSIDIVRGVIMIIMALDHVRDYFHDQAFTDDPTNMATTTPVLFFTRWITHFCAPIFVFLAGTSAYLSGLKKTKAALSGFLIKRGFWLVCIEVVVITLGWTFNPFFNVIILQVIWAIGISMILLGLLVRLPYWVIAAIGFMILFYHNQLDIYEAARNHQVNLFWNFLHNGHFVDYPIAANHVVLIVYAFVPWTGIMLLGYAFGKLYAPEVDSAWRRRVLIYLGIFLLVNFVILRLFNNYGDPAPWSVQERGAVYTFLSFLNITKYPPSLMYSFVTIGFAMLALAYFEKIQNRLTAVFNIFGRVPFFYYVLHIYLIHLLCVIAFFISGYGTKDIISDQVPFLFRPLTFGYPIWVTYVVWIFVIALLYPLCKWYNRYKSTHKNWWLSYL